LSARSPKLFVGEHRRGEVHGLAESPDAVRAASSRREPALKELPKVVARASALCHPLLVALMLVSLGDRAGFDLGVLM